MTRTPLWLLGAWLALQPATLLAETLYTNKNDVEVTQDANPASKVVTTLGKGAMVQVVSKKDRFVQVKLTNGSKGWIYQFKLTKDAPKSGGGVDLGALTGTGSVHAKEARSGGSIRGLQPASEGYARNRRIDASHVHSLERMERFQVSEGELTRFKQEGRIGEFQGAGS
ncbi:MAG: hypothetical protein HQL99_01225 [Magnetococcales bacterium]|nr:hypothetical protein [Magnetococcales bacterium]